MKFLISLLFVANVVAFSTFDVSCCSQEINLSINDDSLTLNDSFALKNFYQNHQNNLQWEPKDLNEFIKATNDPMKNYLSYDYHQDEIETLLFSLDSYGEYEKKTILAKIDVLATDGFFMFAKDLSVGLIDVNKFKSLISQKEIKPTWATKKNRYNYANDLSIALKTDMLEALIEKYLPISDEYFNLVKAYHHYVSITFPKVDYGKLMKTGDYGYRATQLKSFLVVTGDLEEQAKSYMEFPTYDDTLAEALKRFQKRHYIKETGELDKVTVLYTRKTAASKANLIKLNIERQKLFEKIFDKEYIRINIPEFSLKYYRNGEQLDDIFIVVGREDRPTPIFSDSLEYMVLNPSWIIPQGLLRKDYIPLLVDNPDAMIDEHIHIHTKPSRYSPEVDTSKIDWLQYLEEGKYIPYYFMQYPGEDNVLGQMKFIFPNKYNVYLHDTNSKSLTTLKYRLYSSGCIRLSRPYDLLQILSTYTNYSADALNSIIESGKSKNISLKRKIPIHIQYFTVFMNGNSSPSFRKDFYGLDDLQLQSMSQY